MDLNENSKKVKIGLLLAALMLCAAVIPSMPYRFWLLLKWVVCGAAVYGAFYFKDEERLRGHLLPLLILAILFNPFVPVLLTPLVGLILCLGTAIYFLALSKKF